MSFSESKEKINHILFMDGLKLYSRSEKGLNSLVQTVRVFSEDIGIDFTIEKCSMLVMVKGKIVKSVGIFIYIFEFLLSSLPWFSIVDSLNKT